MTRTNVGEVEIQRDDCATFASADASDLLVFHSLGPSRSAAALGPLGSPGACDACATVS